MNSKSEAFNLEHCLAYRIKLLSRRVTHSITATYLSELEISIPEWRVLLWINDHNDGHAKDISTDIFMDKTQISRILTQLEKRELIERITDRKDMRSSQLCITAQGKAKLEESVIPKLQDWEDSFVANIKVSDLDRLFDVITKLEKNIDKIEDLSVPKT